MRTLVIMLISFMEGYYQDTLRTFCHKESPPSKKKTFGHHETIRIKENLDTQAFSLKIYFNIGETCAIALKFSMATGIHYINGAMKRRKMVLELKWTRDKGCRNTIMSSQGVTEVITVWLSRFL